MVAMLRVSDQDHEAAPAVIAESERAAKRAKAATQASSTEILLNTKTLKRDLDVALQFVSYR